MNNWKKSSVIYTLGGIAVSASALFYLYQKRKQQLNDPLYILDDFVKKFYKTPYNKLLNMNSKFNRIINYSIKNQFFQKSDDSESDLSQPYCKNLIQNEGYYECFTCNNENNEKDKYYLEYAPLFSVNQYCPDCFDQEYHKDHIFRRKPYNGNQQCDCGNGFRIPKDSFCKNHSGFKVQDINQKKEYNQLKQNCMRIFKEAFFHLIDQLGDFINERENGKSNMQLQYHFNFFFTIIIEKISSLIAENSIYLSIMSELFVQPILKPTRIDTKNDVNFEILSQKQVDEKESILEYLIRMQQFINEENDILFSNLLNCLRISNQEFNIFAIERLLKLIKFSIYVIEDDDDVTIYQTKVFEESLKGLQTLQLSYKIIQKNPELYINSIKYVNYILQNIQFNQATDYRFIYTCSVILSQLVQLPIIFKENFSVVVQYAEELVFLHATMYEKLILKEIDTEEDYSKQFLKKYPLILGLIEIQKNLFLYFRLLVINLKQMNSIEQRHYISQVVSFQFFNQIQRVYNISKVFRDIHEEELLHCSACLFPLIIYIIILSNDTIDFTLNGIKHQLIKAFQFYEKDQLSNFIEILNQLMKNNIFQCYEYPSSYWRWYLEMASQQSAEYQVIQASYDSWILQNNYLYDHFILTQQILLLLNEDSENNLFYSLVQKFIERPQYGELSDSNYEFTESHYLYIFMNQCLFDTTPILNIVALSKDFQLASFKNSNISDQINYSINQTIRQILTFHRRNLQFYSDVKLQVKKYLQIDDQTLIACLNNIIQVDPVTDKFTYKEEKGICLYNVGRSFSYIEEETCMQFARFQGLVSIEFLQNLFEFQQQIIIKYFSDKLLLKYFIQRIEMEKNNNNFSSISPYLHSYIILFDFVINLKQSKPDLFSSDQLEQVELVQKMLYKKENYQNIMNVLEKAILNQQNEQSYQDIIRYIKNTKDFYQQQYLKQYKNKDEDLNESQNQLQNSSNDESFVEQSQELDIIQSDSKEADREILNTFFESKEILKNDCQHQEEQIKEVKEEIKNE